MQRHSRDPLRRVRTGSLLLRAIASNSFAADEAKLPDWLVFPGEQWVRITPQQAGMDVAWFEKILTDSNVQPGGWGGTPPMVLATPGSRG